MLLEQAPAGDNRQMLGGIRDQSEHLFSLLCDLMTLAELDTGEIVLEVSSVRVRSVLGRLRPLVERLRHGSDIEVVWVEPPACPPIETDALRLAQILTNLIGNAFKFTPRGTITIRAAYEAALERVTFEVADTGMP